MADNLNESVVDFLKTTLPAGSCDVQVDADVIQELGGGPSNEDGDLPTPTMERVEIPMDLSFDPNNPSQTNQVYWSMSLPAIGTIEVDYAEKQLYLKTMVNDDPLRWTITLPAVNFSVTFASRSVFEQRAIFEALRTRLDTKEVANDEDYITRLQHLCAATMIKEINHREFPVLELPTKSVKEAGEAIAAHAAAHIEPMSSVKWNTILATLRVFEAKMKLCNDNVTNESFWKPVS